MRGQTTAAVASVFVLFSVTACGGDYGGSGGPGNTSPAATTPAAKTAELPDLVGKGLQSAQDAAQAAGFFQLPSHDSLGRGRNQILDRDWNVCFQTPEPGRHSTKTKIDLGAVKLDEACPAEDAAAPTGSATEMPQLTGKSVKVARESLDPSTSIDVKDASGAGRAILIESNWKVCSQRPTAGTKLTGQPVSLTAVKFDESCP
jgi:hypothetical protein